MAQKVTKLVGKPSRATDPSLRRRNGATRKASKSQSSKGTHVPTSGGDRGLPSVPNRRVG